MGLARLAAANVPGSDPANWYGLLPISTEEPLTDMASEKVTVRPSQLESYLKCPLHWFLQNHGGRSDSFSASLGTLVHEVLEVSSSSNLAELQRLTDSRWHSLEFEAGSKILGSAELPRCWQTFQAICSSLRLRDQLF
jgi:hypothetical protein